jgi:hypothetical protein
MKTLIHQHPRFVGGLIALLATGIVAAAVLVERAQAATRTGRELQRNRLSLRSLVLSVPSAEVLRQTSDDLADVSRDLMETQAAFRARAARANVAQQQPMPETTAAAFFDLVEFGGRMRERARQVGVRLSADERFGFAEHANTGPEPELIAAVFRQRIIVEHLLEVLWNARPDDLIAVRREQPRTTDTVRSERDEAARARDDGGSFLALEPGVSARRTGAIEATAFRLEFVGHTPVLRRLLNSIAEDEWPLSVRLVEASPAGLREGERSGVAVSEDSAFVTSRPMKFAVTIEFVEVPLSDAANVPGA